MNILETFYILFKSDAEKVQRENQAAEASAVGLAAAVDAAGAAHVEAGVAAVEASQLTTAAALENAAAYYQTGVAAELAGAAAVHAAVEGTAALELETAAVNAETAAYVFNRSQRMELMGLARHSFDQLASGGSLMRVVTSHAATLAEALANGPGGLAAGFGALAGAAGRFVKAFGLPIAIIGSLVAAVGMGKAAVKDLETTRINADRSGLAVEDYDAIRKVVRNLGGDMKEVDRDLERFATRVDDAFGSLSAKKPDAIAKAFAGVKVSLRGANGAAKDTKTALLDLAGALEHVSKEKQAATLRQLGFETPRHGKTDKGMLALLTGGRAKMEEYIETEKRLGGVTKEQTEIAHKYKLQVEILGDRFRDLRNTIAQYVLPVLTDLVAGIRQVIEWVRLNSTLVSGFAIAFVGMATIVAAATWGTLIPAFAAAAVAVIAATWPILLIGAAVAAAAFAFAALYEDVKFFLKGQPSLLGELVNKYEWVRKTVHAIGDAFKWIGKEGRELWTGVTRAASAFGNWIAPFFKGIAQVLGPIAGLILDIGKALAKAFGPTVITALKIAILLPLELVKGLIGAFTQIAGLLIKGLKAAADFLGPYWDKMFQGWLKQLYMLIGGVRELLHLSPDLAVNQALNPAAAAAPGINAGQRAIAFAGTTPLATHPRSMVAAHRTTHVHIDRVEVHTQATDADGIAAGIDTALKSHVRSAASAFDNGVDR